jgi:hypothetical protein
VAYPNEVERRRRERFPDRIARADFSRVERLLAGSFRALDGRVWSLANPTQPEIIRALRVVSAAVDPEQAYVRRCGAEIGLIRRQLPIPLTPPLELRARPLTGEQIEAIHGYTGADTAGYELAKQLTGLPGDMLALIGGDQVSDEAILGCSVPEQARPILRALDDRYEHVLGVPDSMCWPPERIDGPEPPNDDANAILGWLLGGRSNRIRAEELPTGVRSLFAKLLADEILDLTNGASQASHIALYSSFLQPQPAPQDDP